MIDDSLARWRFGISPTFNRVPKVLQRFSRLATMSAESADLAFGSAQV